VNHIDKQSLRQPWWRTFLLGFVFLITAVAFWLLATVPLGWSQQALLGGSCLVLAVLIKRFSTSGKMTLVLSMLSIFSTFRYAYFRVWQTYMYLSVNWSEARVLDLVFVFALLGAELYAFLILFLGFFQTIRPLNRRPVTLPEDPGAWPSVDVFIPTYNEPLDVVRATVLSALSMDWPAKAIKVFLLDDGKRNEFREFAESCGCQYIVRPNNKHAKAGNINHALAKTNGEYVVIFDCDHIPTRSFLQVAMGWFLQDPKLGMLQTPHHFYSPDPFERNLGIFRKIPNEGALFYGVIQDGSDFWNGTFYLAPVP
jgi:cellulose synthase (UDP-forming)